MKLTPTLLALVATTLLAAQDQTPQQTAEISGRIVDSATKLPVSGVRVVLARWSNGAALGRDTIDKTEAQSQPQDPASPIFAVLTGADGRYSFRVTAPAYFRLYTRREGYVPWGGRMIRATAAGKREVGDIAIDQWGTITGRIVDAETGKPVPGFAVSARFWEISGGCRVLSSAGEPGLTNRDGVYELKMLPPRSYVIDIQPAQGERFEPAGTAQEFRDHTRLAYLHSYYPGAERREQAQAVLLTPGATLDRIDVKLTQRRGAAIRGCIHSDLDPGAMGDVAIDLDSVEAEGHSTSFSNITHWQARTGDCFRVEGISPGRYLLAATNGKEDTGEARVGYALLDLDDQRIDDFALEMRQPVTVPGKVVFPATAQATGAGREQLQVHLRALDRPVSARERAAAAAVLSGAFTLPAVVEGSYAIFLTGLPPGAGLDEVRYNGAHAGRDTFTFQPGAPGQQLELILAPATASLQVKVEDGAKSAGWEVALLNDPADAADAPGIAASNTFADDEGRASFTGLLAGKYRIAAFPPNVPWRTDPSLLRQLTEGQAVGLSVGAAMSIEVQRTALQ